MHRAWLGVAIAAAVPLALALGCQVDSTPASPTYTPNPYPEAAAPPLRQGSGGGPADAAVDVYTCPTPSLDASYADLLGRLFSTSTCGTGNGLTCHSTAGAEASGNALDFTLDAAAVYAELLGADGGGVVAQNVGGYGPPIDRVVPFDAGASLLFVKLTLGAEAGPHGQGMPLGAQGSLCQPAITAVKQWINAGALQN